jgi:serine/threonine protein kinase
MTPEEWHKIREVLQNALEIDPPARGEFLDSACSGETSVRTEVEELLRSHDEDRAFLEQPAVVDASDLTHAAASGTWTGKRLGPYQILEQIGEGGMGAVYRAVRADGMYDKQVAIKLIRGGFSSDFFVSRFRNERQILAALEHPNIARLLDGGINDEGVPYLVLEFVAGTSIDEYCDRHDVSIPDRLKLFRTVCSAVQYAHQNLVVHRDLKPGNILVNEDGVPKLLDFGVAKIMDPHHQETGADRTLTVMRLMTPDFASPEQVRGDPITTSSDIYSLGVILYLLLAGRRPYRMSGTAPHEIIKAVCDTDPEKPSTAVTRIEKSGQTPPADADPAAQTASSPLLVSRREKLRRALTGDLDNIVLKALRKEPERRYATVEQFSEDVRRHLENLPVIARKDTPAYRASKFILRHRTGVAATAVVSLLLIVALAAAVSEARVAARRFNDVRSLANSLIFDVHDSIKDLPGSTPARKVIIDRALQYLNSLAQESSGDTTLQRELSNAYERVGTVQGGFLQNSLGDTRGSLMSYQKALAIRKQIATKSSDWHDRVSLAEAYRLVATQQWALGERPTARQNIDMAVAISEALNSLHANEFQVLHELGFDYEVSGDISYPGNPNSRVKSSEDYRKALAMDEATLRIKPDDLHTLDGYAIDLSSIGGHLERTDPKSALPYYQKELEIEQELHRRSTETRYTRGVAIAYGHIASVYDDLEDYPRALENYLEDLRVYQQLANVDPNNVTLQMGLAISYTNAAEAASKVGDISHALDNWKKGSEIMHRVVSAAPENARQRDKLAQIVMAGATIQMHAHNPEAARKEFDEARGIYQSLHEGHPSEQSYSVNAAACREKMGEAELLAGNRKLAADYFQQSLSVVEPMLSIKQTDLGALYAAADAYAGLGDLKRSEASQPVLTLENRKANWTEAISWYSKSLDTWKRIEHPSRSAPNDLDASDPAIITRRLESCQATVARLSHATRISRK